MSFFVSSATSVTGNLGGLAGADAVCQRLATAVGQGSGRLWRAYLSVERDASNANRPTNARDRIGLGPWFNASGVAVANNLTELHSRSGDAAIFIDERGQRINGQWTGSPAPERTRHHDRLECGRHARAWIDLRRLDVGVGDGHRAGRALRRDGSERRAPPARWRRGTPRTPIRTARTRRRAGARAASTVSPDSRLTLAAFNSLGRSIWPGLETWARPNRLPRCLR